MLGICFGSQLLARALGGEAMRGRRPEIGWVSIHTDDPELIAEGPWLEWHYDTFTPAARREAAGPQRLPDRRRTRSDEASAFSSTPR